MIETEIVVSTISIPSPKFSSDRQELSTEYKQICH